MSGKLIADLEKADISRLTGAVGSRRPDHCEIARGKWDLYGLMFTADNLTETENTRHN